MQISNKTINILYMEDDLETNPIDFSNIKGYEKFCFSVATNCEEARELIGKTKFDVFILDIEIKSSRESGIQFAEEIRIDPQYSSTPIIFTSEHTHYSFALLSYIKHSSFLSKPVQAEALIEQIYLMLNIPEYQRKYYSYETLMIPTASNAYLEIKPNQISYIEAIGKDLIIQYISGKTVRIPTKYGIFKNVTEQLKGRNVACLRQIHRSIIINIHQISDIFIEKNVGFVYLFAEEKPKPLGIRYRSNLSDFIKEGKKNGL